MKKYRKFTVIFAVAIMLLCTLGLFACASRSDSGREESHIHAFGNYVYNDDATCVTAGTETAKCEKCDKTDTRPSASHPATGIHTYNSNNICTVCGARSPEPSTKNYKTVTFDANGGNVSISSKQFEVGKVMSGLPVPTRDGYNFICWDNAVHGEFTAATVMPNVDFTLVARWEKRISKYEDDYVSFSPATQGVKNRALRDLYGNDVDEFVYVELTSDDLGGIQNVGRENNFTLRTLDSMQYSLKNRDHTWAWYQGDFNTPNGAQRFTLRYGSNIQFVTVSEGGIVQQTYLLDIYVRHDYYVSLYKNIYESTPYDRVRVIENDRLPDTTPSVPEGNFEFDKRVYLNSSTHAYESFVYSTAITQNWNLYQTYKPVSLTATLTGGSVNGALTVTPYEKYFELPTATKDGYDFMGWKLSDGKYLTDINGFGGDKYYSKDTAELSVSAEFARTKFYYTFENDELRTQKTVPVVTYTDKTNSEIAEILHVPHNTDCALPTKSPDTTQAIFKGWRQYAKKNGGGYYTTPSDFDFNVKVTEPIALVPEYTGTLTNDPSSDIYQSAVAINSQNSYSARGTFKMYLPAKEEYTLVITPSSGMQITVNSYGNESAKNYTISAGSPYSIRLNYYVYNYGSEWRAKGEVSFSVTSGSGTFTAELVGSTAETDGCPIELTDDNSKDVGKAFTVAASEKDGYTWVGWYDGNRELTKEMSYTFNMPSENKTYMAKWIKVTVDRNDASAGTVSSLTETYKVGDSATITATTNSGYTWVGWYDGETELTKELSYTFAMPSENKTYMAKWIKVMVDKNVSNAGTVSSLTETYKVGDSATITATTNIGYAFVGWYDGETELTKELNYTFAMPSENTTFMAKWNKDLSVLENFIYSVNNDKYTITGIKDKSVIEISVPGYVDEIAQGAFNGCGNLESIILPFVGASRTATSNMYFGYIFGAGGVPSSLKTVVITDVTSIGSDAFSGCHSLTSVTIPDSVTSIGSDAFRNCSSLTSITIPNSVTSIKNGAFMGCSSLTSITIPNGVTSIWSYAFSDCSSLTSITIPNGVTSIGYRAFYCCRSLTSITIPNGVTSIGDEAFNQACDKISSVRIPSSVKKMGKDVFFASGTYPPNLTIYCEASYVPEEWNADWNRYYNRMNSRFSYHHVVWNA